MRLAPTNGLAPQEMKNNDSILPTYNKLMSGIPKQQGDAFLYAPATVTDTPAGTAPSP